MLVGELNAKGHVKLTSDWRVTPWGERTAVFKILKRLAGRGASGGLRLTGPGRACSVSTVISFGDSDVVEHCDWQ